MRPPRRISSVRPSSYLGEVEAADEATVSLFRLLSLFLFLLSLQPRGFRRVGCRRNLVQTGVSVRLPLRQGVS